MTQEKRIELAENLNKLQQTLSRMEDISEILVPGYRLTFTLQDVLYDDPWIRLLAVAFDPATAKDPILAATVKYKNQSSLEMKNNLYMALVCFRDMLTGANIPEMSKVQKLEKEVVEALKNDNAN